MAGKALVGLIREGKLGSLVAISRQMKPFYTVSFVAAAKECGLLERLAAGPVGFEALAGEFGGDAKQREALEAWLGLGVRLGLLGRDARGYRLAGLAAKLARPENDAALALTQEMAELHRKLIAETPGKLKRGELWSLEDQDGEVIARSSRVMEAFQVAAIGWGFPSKGPVRLLEVGCGSGVYIRHAAERNPELMAVGLELQPAVAEAARANLRAWGLEGRVAVEVGDVREREASAEFDVVTLYNNIYYFPVAERVELLKRLSGFLKPGGALVTVTCCLGGSLAVEALNLWGAATAGAGRLPAEAEMRAQMEEAGFAEVQSKRLIPGESYFAFKGRKG